MNNKDKFLEWVRKKVPSDAPIPAVQQLPRSPDEPILGFREHFELPVKEVPDVYGAITKDGTPTASWLERKRLAKAQVSPEVARILRDLHG